MILRNKIGRIQSLTGGADDIDNLTTGMVPVVSVPLKWDKKPQGILDLFFLSYHFPLFIYTIVILGIPVIFFPLMTMVQNSRSRYENE